ncbi:hypothetical protein ACH4EC_22550 [Streptomyces anulatus]
MPDIHRAVGLGSGDLIERLLGSDRDPEQDAAISSAHTVLHSTYFDRIPRADLERAGAEAVYRDVAELLDRLDESPFGPAPG